MTIAQDVNYGFSPESNSPSDPQGSMLFDDQDDFFNESKPKKSTGRKGPGGADKRATHNATERARRESLNGRFMTLAEALPSMARVKRPSKSVIVNKALDFVYEAQVKEHALVKENNDLRRQVDQLRAQLGLPPLPAPAPLTAAVPAHSPTAGSPTQSTDGVTQYTDLAASMNNLDTNSTSPSSQQGGVPAELLASPASSVALETSPQLAQPFLPDMFSASTGSPATSESSEHQHLGTIASPTATQLPGVPSAVHAPSPSPFLPQYGGMHAQAQAMMQAHQFGFMNPAMLSQQQQHHQTMMLAAHLQQQQQQMQHTQQQQTSAPFDVYGINAMAPLMGGWGSFGAGSPADQFPATYV